MKIRYLSIIFTVIMVFLTFMIYWVVEKSDYQAADLPTINKAYTQVIKKLEDGVSIDSLEKEFHCKILLASEDDYATQMYEALGDGDILLDYAKGNTLLGKIVFNGIASKYDSLKKEIERRICYLGILILIAINVILFLIYQYYIKPFQKLKSFAADVAKGNLDHRLEITKNSYFGAFTESFDIMREELRKAREAEYRANTSKKELVASLSHDMKTPISTIKVTCEVLMMKETDQGRKEKIDIIAQKANMIDTLIDNMFHATLEELQLLKVEPKEELSDIIEPMFKELQYYGTIHLSNKVPECLIFADKLRLNQAIDNIINNSYKYAGTPIEVSFEEENKSGIKIIIKDRGKGVSNEELPMVMEKYYRGNNSKGKNGSGLGLYLAKSFLESMNGGMECYNDNGFTVVLFLKKV